MKLKESVLREKVFEYDAVTWTVLEKGAENVSLSKFIQQLLDDGWSIAQRDVVTIPTPGANHKIRYIYHCVRWEDIP